MYFLQYNLFSPYQSGFRPGHSMQDVLLYVVDSWRKAIDARKFVVAGFLDFAKAFDCVNHDILLHKLAHCGWCCGWCSCLACELFMWSPASS